MTFLVSWEITLGFRKCSGGWGRAEERKLSNENRPFWMQNGLLSLESRED